MSLNQNDDCCLFASTGSRLESRRLLTHIFSPDDCIFYIETAPAIKQTPQNKGQNVDTKSRLNGWDLWYLWQQCKERNLSEHQFPD